MIEQIGNEDKFPLQPPEGVRAAEKIERRTQPPTTDLPEKLDNTSHQRLEEDTIEISATARQQQVERQREEVEQEAEEDNLQFTGNHFYTLGLNLIKQEEIAPPSEPEIKP
ncbi:MAG: hypothetical protein ISR91_05545 [Candidatus Delongbacteria bacterium]|nr:hypothetical protein [Candidatus Delongbacteria bacterium]